MADARRGTGGCLDSVAKLGGGVRSEGGVVERGERGDFGRWLPRLLTMAWRLAYLLMHASGFREAQGTG